MDYWMVLRYVCIIMTAIFFHVAMVSILADLYVELAYPI